MSHSITHRLLQRQIRRHFGEISNIPEAWHPFMAAIDQTYHQADEDLTRVERTLEVSSQELMTANAKMQVLLQSVEQQVADRTAEVQRSHAELETTLQQLQAAQSQLIQTEKMSSLGQLVAGIAHEINNPINFIHGNLSYASQYAQELLNLVELYQQCYPTPSPQLQARLNISDLDFMMEDFNKLITSMQMGVDRIRQIVISLRNFSRIDEADMKVVNIHEGIDSTLLILQHRLQAKRGQKIQLIRDYQALPPVECYPGQLNQVFMNLLANAIDALEDSPKFFEQNPTATMELESKIQRVLRRSCDLAELQEQTVPTIWIQTAALPNGQVQIRFLDNGIGIPATLKSRLFDPFFTTKPVGKGTGLGLSISYQIIHDRHQGCVACHSVPGLGTEFVITIPVSQTSPVPRSPIEV